MIKVDKWEVCVLPVGETPTEDDIPEGFTPLESWYPFALNADSVGWRRSLVSRTTRVICIPWERGCIVTRDERPSTLPALPGFTEETFWTLQLYLSWERSYWKCTGRLDLTRAPNTLRQYQITREPAEMEVPYGFEAEPWEPMDPLSLSASHLWVRILRRLEVKP